MNNIDHELNYLLENAIIEQLNCSQSSYAELRKALVEEIRNIEKIGNAMRRKLRYFEDIVNFSEVNNYNRDIDDFLKDALKGNKYASIYVTGFTQDGNEQYANLENKEINELKSILNNGLIHKDLFYIVNDWIYFELRLKASALNEATIVNKFKKEMHLFNVGRSKRDTLDPNYLSAGNRLEKQSGKAIFFFSTYDEAVRYAVARGIELAWKEFWEFSVVPAVQGIKNENVYNEVVDYCNILRKILMGGKLPPVYFAYGVHMKYYGLDDTTVYPRFPLCSIFAKHLVNSKTKLYIRECVVDTKDIKHGHSADFKEFTVFKSCPVYKNHEITLGDAFKKMQVTYLKTTDDFLKYPTIINDTKKDKDWFRKFIQHKDEYKMKFYNAIQNKNAEKQVVTEATIVNKFKKSMTLYNAGNGPAEMLYPKYPSAGNRLEKQSGEAVFFFSTMEEAKSYAIAKGIIEHFKGFINYVMKEVKTIENDQVRNAIYDYIDLLANSLCMGGKIPPIYASHGTKPKFYGIDDSEIMPRFPLANMFRESLKQSDIRIYVRECVVETKDIKHGHSSDYKEFTVFKPCKVYKNHEFILGKEFSKLNVTYLKTSKEVSNYPKLILNKEGKDKDWFRKLITYKDFAKRIDPMFVQESLDLRKLIEYKYFGEEIQPMQESANIKFAEVEVIYGDWDADITVWEVGNDISPLDVINIDLPKKFHSNSAYDEYWEKRDFNKELLAYARKQIESRLNKKGIKIKRIFLH